MNRLDSWCLGRSERRNESAITEWYRDAVGLRLGGFLGFGTEFVLLTICLLLNNIQLYLFFSMIVLNCVWISAIALSKNFSRGKNIEECDEEEIGEREKLFLCLQFLADLRFQLEVFFCGNVQRCAEGLKLFCFFGRYELRPSTLHEDG